MQILKTRPDGYIWVEKKKTYGINKIYFKIIYNIPLSAGARGGAFSWGTMLQAWTSRVRFPMASL